MKYKLTGLLLIAAILFQSLGGGVLAAEGKAAAPTSARVYLNGDETSFEAYEVEDNNYFKLRDLAYALNGTAKGFSVTWNGAQNAIYLVKAEPYRPVGGEMLPTDGRLKQAYACGSAVFLDGLALTLKAYNIAGSNYFKLRDLMQALDISVVWDGAQGRILIDTGLPYEADTPENARPLVLPVLLYHHLSPIVSNTMMVTPGKFRADMAALKEAGFTTMLPGDLIEANRKNEFPKNPIMITFDDGYESNYQYAFPILKELGMKATIFTIGWSVGKNTMPDGLTPITPHFTLAQGREMVESGLVSVQPHSYDLHRERDLPNQIAYGIQKLPGETISHYAARFNEDFLRVRDILELGMGDKVVSYSYPYGLNDETADMLLKKEGIALTFTVQDSFSYLDFGSDLYHLKRMTVTNDLPSEQLVAMILQTKAAVTAQHQ